MTDLVFLGQLDINATERECLRDIALLVGEQGRTISTTPTEGVAKAIWEGYLAATNKEPVPLKGLPDHPNVFVYGNDEFIARLEERTTPEQRIGWIIVRTEEELWQTYYTMGQILEDLKAGRTRSVTTDPLPDEMTRKEREVITYAPPANRKVLKKGKASRLVE